MSDIIKFEFNQPVEVALAYTEPKVFPSQFAGGDDRYMYSTCDGRVMYHTPLTAAKIKALDVVTGEPFFIVKVKNGRLTEYNVFREGAEPLETPAKPAGIVKFGGHKKTYPPHVSSLPERLYAPAPVPVEQARPVSLPAETELEQQLKASIDMVQARKQPQTATEPAWVGTLVSQTNHLVDAFAASLQHASKHGIAVKPEDVRSLLVTSFIQLSQKSKERAA